MALAYELFSFNLMVWQGRHQFTVMLDGLGGGDAAGQRAAQVAQAILPQI